MWRKSFCCLEQHHVKLVRCFILFLATVKNYKIRIIKTMGYMLFSDSILLFAFDNFLTKRKVKMNSLEMLDKLKTLKNKIGSEDANILELIQILIDDIEENIEALKI